MTDVNLAGPKHKADPFPYYARLRAESPVHRVTLADKQAVWLVTRYDDVAAALKDKRLAKDRLNALTPGQVARQPWMPKFARPLTRNMLAGVTIPQGSQVYCALASANRDETQFPDPDTLDLARNPNRHLSFGLGPHYCLGAPLARLEGRIALATLLRRTSSLRLDTDPKALRWKRGLVLRGLRKLPLTTTRRGKK